ncbi:MFS transporter [Brevundimonas sp. SORGH_AS_0993]|uniref:MFS transporter n=1 Tax=Brevundimonas sp. SORGH_AS_0993 TaxID=3041794 RepID=UPI0027841E6A|nr:MFS transporter [Brevundimonas sp. SORGH_AS_0993]MDQ1155658.1 MFS family permease [Brevundimonas sp. SORGH_AS_0993]
MNDADAAFTPSPPRVGPGFIAALTLAYIGGFIGFVPLLSLIVPLQAQALASGDKVALLSLVSLSGAMTASVANLAAGWASDRTRSRFGRRRPWIIAGLAGVIVAYGLIAWAQTPTALLAGAVAFQLAFNLMFAPLNAVLADVVPDVQKGRVAAFLGLGPPMGAASGLLIALPHVGGATTRVALLAALVVACILPLLLSWRERPWAPPPPSEASTDEPRTRLSADFGFTWASRFLMQIAASVVNAFMLFYLADYALYGERFPGSTVESGLARLIAFSTLLIVVSGFVGGLASDRYRRCRLFIVLSAVLVATGLGVFALWPQWPGPLIGYAFYGVGLGLYTTVDVALVAQVLPSRRHTARDLGIMNLTNTLPAVLAPLLALVALGPDRQGWPLLMALSAAIALAGGLAVLGVRRVR